MRPAAAVVALGVAVATGVPVAWAVSRPPAAAGAQVTTILRTSSPDTPPAPPPSPVRTASAAPDHAGPAPAPVRVSLPALGVDAPVDPVGVAPDGQMEIPADVDRAGWYRFGPRPGEAGNAVLAGHVDDAQQGLGALAALREVVAGAEVVVTDDTGTATRWRVVGRELVDKQALPLDLIFAREGPPRLVLVTCGGPFLPELRSYRDNVIVVAEQIR